MSTAHVLLALLADGARHGYDLKRAIEKEFGAFWNPNIGQLYRLLARIARAGWVKTRVEPSPHGPNRKIYTLTPRGRRELNRWLNADTPNAPTARVEFLSKLRLALSQDPARARELVSTQRRALETPQPQIEMYGGCQQAARLAPPTSPEHLIVAEAARHAAEADLAHLDFCASLVNPRGVKSARGSRELAIVGSDDPILDLLARFGQEMRGSGLVTVEPVGSMRGLMALQEHRADAAGVHLLDVETGEYNLPFVKHFLPEEPIVLVHLANREQGLMVAPGNPKKIRGVRDLVRPRVRFINRQRGAGTRLLIYQKLRAARIDPRQVSGYTREMPTHRAVAEAVAVGAADVGPGLRAVAEEWGLDFIPLGEECFDLVIARAVFDSPRSRTLREILHRADFRQRAASFKGYDLSEMGKVIAQIK
jgi:molybdate-binding protein/DNA-binding PadR family transcriptional regulator